MSQNAPSCLAKHSIVSETPVNVTHEKHGVSINIFQWYSPERNMSSSRTIENTEVDESVPVPPLPKGSQSYECERRTSKNHTTTASLELPSSHILGRTICAGAFRHLIVNSSGKLSVRNNFLILSNDADFTSTFLKLFFALTAMSISSDPNGELSVIRRSSRLRRGVDLRAEYMLFCLTTRSKRVMGYERSLLRDRIPMGSLRMSVRRRGQ
ncbi:hypothetical protein EDD18DRAFT_395915 [Armillaria luteobubalina]|uniref:Uncharacterized protein n=1 Tax=Armillaria luteobubalina TaxID=153913 RepID=A0AA39Q165_9AGAR|nr:hypothetical protein EDD18DRAFT_395915 [Armillaria luteobubalina]